MPTYNYKCPSCQKVEEKIHLISETPEYKCCGVVMEKIFTPNIGGFILKGGTAAIHYREKQQRLKKAEKLKEKQKAVHGSGPRIQPNIAGVEVDSWSDAQKMAKEAGLNHESYSPYVEKEGKKKIIV